jgi:hypothetical protein
VSIGIHRLVRTALALGLLLGAMTARSAAADASGARAAAVPPVVSGAASFRLAETSSLWLEGSTNVNRFRCRSRALDAAVELDVPRAVVLAALDRFESERRPRDDRGHSGDARQESSALPAPRFRLALPIATLDCASRGIERDLRAALDADRYPAIVFELVGVAGVERSAAVGEGKVPSHRLDLRGALTLRDRRREIRTTVWATRSSPTRYRLSGELPLRMSEFEIRPPVVLFCLIRVRDELRLRFDVEVELGSPAGPSSPPGSPLEKES